MGEGPSIHDKSTAEFVASLRGVQIFSHELSAFIWNFDVRMLTAYSNRDGLSRIHTPMS